MDGWIDGWIIQEWPHSRALGEKWVAFQKGPADPNEPRIGLKFFDSREEAVAHVESWSDGR